MTLPMTIAAARKMEMSPEKVGDALIWGGSTGPWLVRLCPYIAYTLVSLSIKLRI